MARLVFEKTMRNVRGYAVKKEIWRDVPKQHDFPGVGLVIVLLSEHTVQTGITVFRQLFMAFIGQR